MFKLIKNKNPAAIEEEMHDPNLAIRLANNTTEDVDTTANIKFKIEDEMFNEKFLVIESMTFIILGMNFIIKNNVILDFYRKTIRIGERMNNIYTHTSNPDVMTHAEITYTEFNEYVITEPKQKIINKLKEIH